MAEEESWYSDTFAPLIEAWRWLKTLLPTSLRPRRPNFNFIQVHYFYIAGTALIWSIMVYPAGNVAYIDSLFFAAGTSTQSGLNTINFNLLNTYQQVTLMLGCCICTPVFINTVVVFVRLYWFEKRFVHIVKEQRALRRAGGRTLSWSRSRSRSRAKGDEHKSANHAEMGIRGLPIRVLKRASFMKTNDNQQTEDEKADIDPMTTSVDTTSNGSRREGSGDADGTISSGPTMTAQEQDTEYHTPMEQQQDSPRASFLGLNPRLARGITFADEIEPAENTNTREPAQAPDQQALTKHIEFLERQQQNAKKSSAYRIPGPREMEQGEVPERLDIQRLHSTGSGISRGGSRSEEHSPEDHRMGRNITIAEPVHPARGANGEESSGLQREQSRSGLSQRRGHRGFSLSEGPRSFARTWTNRTRERNEDPMPYLSWTATTGRNSAFLGLTADQRDELGGIEYRALKKLAKILLCYFFGIHIIAMCIFLPWIAALPYWADKVSAIGQNPLWWGIFTPASMFNDLGFTLNPDSMISFREATMPLLVGSFLIVVGNTGFPCFLRFVIWVLAEFEYFRGGKESNSYLELRFLLDHPRRCFTLLFPSKATWWLFWVLILLNTIDLVFFIILDLNLSDVTSLPVGFRILDGLFQAVSTRTAGFACVDLADLHAAIQVSYLVMMYISVFPIAISVRRTNVYEEKSLGVFGGEEEAHDGDTSYVSQHLRRQLSFDLWYIFLGLFIIAIVEGDRISNTNEPSFTTFSVLFEIVSAYGTVGLSLGYPGVDASFSSQFRTISKLVIIAMMIRGRHRGLPYALDRAILLPSEKLQQREAEESERKLQLSQRRGSALTVTGPWEDGDLDMSGLPRQRTGILEGLSPVHDPDEIQRLNTRRSTAVSTTSHKGFGHSRARSLSRVIAGGLSAGPSMPKRD